MGTAWVPEGGRITADRLLLDTPGGGERQPGSAWLTAGSATATSEGRRIAARIRASGDWFQLRAVLSVSRESLNMLHVTSALSRLAAVAGYDKQVRRSTGGACIWCASGAALLLLAVTCRSGRAVCAPGCKGSCNHGVPGLCISV